jgi:hypothetical protein
MSTDPHDIPMGGPLGGESEPLPSGEPLPAGPPPEPIPIPPAVFALEIDADPAMVMVGPGAAFFRFDIFGAYPRPAPVNLTLKVASPNLATNARLWMAPLPPVDVVEPDAVLGTWPGVGEFTKEYEGQTGELGPGSYVLMLGGVPGGAETGQVTIGLARPTVLDSWVSRFKHLFNR